MITCFLVRDVCNLELVTVASRVNLSFIQIRFLRIARVQNLLTEHEATNLVYKAMNVEGSDISYSVATSTLSNQDIFLAISKSIKVYTIECIVSEKCGLFRALRIWNPGGINLSEQNIVDVCEEWGSKTQNKNMDSSASVLWCLI